MELKYIQKIGEKLGLAIKQVNSVHDLQSEGATIPFMARYRKEATGGLDEVAIGNIVEEIQYFTELDKRKETVLKTIEEQGKMTPELKKRIEDCYSATELEDIYLPYKPKRKTKASQAIEKGLEPLAKLLFEQGAFSPEEEAGKFLNEQVKDTKEALQGARDIIAEWVSEHEQARNKVRQLFTESAVLTSKLYTPKKDEEDAQKYRDYFEFSEPLAQSPSHRLLAIRRGEKEGFLIMDISIDKTVAVEELERIFIKASNPAAAEVKKAIEDSYNRLLKSSIENEFRLQSKNKADEEAIHVFTENLRQLLLSSPLGSKRVLALDPGYRTGCKLVGVVKKQGKQIIGGWGFDQSIVMSYRFARTVMDERRADPLVLVQGRPEINSKVLKEDLRGAMRSVHKLSPTQDDDFSLNDVNDFSDAMSQAFVSVNIGGWAIAALSLIVGMFGVANIMFVTVKERTSQIGLKKAIGAKKGVILTEFLLESAFLCIIGGAVGIALVFIGAQIVTHAADFPIFISSGLLLMAVSICIAVGLLAGIIPAIRAANLDPVVAIRS